VFLAGLIFHLISQ